MELLPRNLDNLNSREARSDSLVSEFVKDGSTEFCRPIESSSRGTHMTDSVPSDWTDEKHHLFLESMEASFVSQMFDSGHSVGSCPSKDNSSRTKLLSKSQSASHVHSHFGQFKVLRRGSWKNINFEPTESRSNFLNEYQALSHNPWIHHFKAARKNKNVACKSQAIGSRGRNSLSLEAANNSGPIRASNSDLSQQYISSNKEVSDQNFVDEVVEVEKGSRDCNAKRVNTSETNALINDQEMVFNKNYLTARR
ncbi:cold-regulated protein 27-like isoform X1 [Cucumis melo]|uniref:Cold-regulated protein 27-like isoform X1 n=3 Tax=Cucumis melo TaxID=3656 RepID=A0A1S3BUX5_CUCME|nr:cold-regulated protein 27-like isoform X1 [Cucumis melo]